jgi:hypothetical protein
MWCSHVDVGFFGLTVDIDVTLSQSEKFARQHPDLLMAGEEIFGKVAPQINQRHANSIWQISDLVWSQVSLTSLCLMN